MSDELRVSPEQMTIGANDIRSDSAHPLLSVRGLCASFGGITALDHVDCDIQDRAIVGIIGPNGAGKTTLFNAITGLVRPDAGIIKIAARRLDGLPPHRIARLGVSRTFQNLGLYPDLTVLENMRLGGMPGLRGGFVAAALRLRIVEREGEDLSRRAVQLLDEVGLTHLIDARVGDLPFGTMKRLELARALMSAPQLLLLDEPAGGLTQGEVDEFSELVRRLHVAHNLTVVLIEHHMRLVMGLCKHIIVLHLGRKLAEGAPDSVSSHPEVIAAYLGTSA